MKRARRRVTVSVEVETLLSLSVLRSRPFWQTRLGTRYSKVLQVQANVIRTRG